MEVLDINNKLPTKKWHSRKTFASDTLKLINARLAYYRKVLKNENITDEKRINSIKSKFERDMKARKLLNRAVNNLYK